MAKNKKETNVLLVEDDELAQLTTKCYLDQAGCSMEVAENGTQALKMVNTKKYDLIFMDLGLLDIDGFTITESIRNSKNLNQKSPIVALTAHLDKSFQKRAKEVGCNEYLIKPIDSDQIKELLKKLGIAN